MPYSEADLERMETDPVLRRQYFWTVANRMLLRAVRYRARGNKFHDGKLLHEAEVQEKVGRAVLEHIDVLVETTGRP